MGSSWLSAPLGELLSYAARGVTPKYIEDPSTVKAVLVLGQRCVRDYDVKYDQARFHDDSSRPIKDEKRVRSADILVNATGVGSAGRVAQVFGEIPAGCLTDSHILTLRAKDIDPVYLGYCIKSKQSVIETMAEGSTGQTEMNKSRLLNEIIITYPKSAEIQKTMASFFRSIDKEIIINNRINDYLAA